MIKKIDIPEDKKHDNWLNTAHNREKLDAALDAGLKSGISERTTKEIFERAIDRLKK